MPIISDNLCIYNVSIDFHIIEVHLRFIYLYTLCNLLSLFYHLRCIILLYFLKYPLEVNYSNRFPINSEIATVTKWSDLHLQPQPRCVEDVMMEAEVSCTTQGPASAALISVSVRAANEPSAKFSQSQKRP